jgi:hypothetical protein
VRAASRDPPRAALPPAGAARRRAQTRFESPLRTHPHTRAHKTSHRFWQGAVCTGIWVSVCGGGGLALRAARCLPAVAVLLAAVVSEAPHPPRTPPTRPSTHTPPLQVVAHECGHQAFSKWQAVNDAVGLVTHSLLLVPYYSWKHSHRRHHSNTGSVSRDEVRPAGCRSTPPQELIAGLQQQQPRTTQPPHDQPTNRPTHPSAPYPYPQTRSRSSSPPPRRAPPPSSPSPSGAPASSSSSSSPAGRYTSCSTCRAASTRASRATLTPARRSSPSASASRWWCRTRRWRWCSTASTSWDVSLWNSQIGGGRGWG